MMDRYESFQDYARMVPLRFTVIPPRLSASEFEAYRDLMDQARYLKTDGGEKVIMEIRGRRNLFRSEARLDSEPVQAVLTFVRERVPEGCEIREEK